MMSLTRATTLRHTDRTTKSICGLRPVSHADFFVPVYTRHSVYSGRVDRPNKIPSGNKASRHIAVVETRPPSFWRATTKLYGGHHA